MNSLVREDFLINQHENIYQFFEYLVFNSFIILILIDYIVYRFQSIGKIKMLEKMRLDNQAQITRVMQITRDIDNINEVFFHFKECIVNTTENYHKLEKNLEDYKQYNSKVLTGLCGGIDIKLLDINFQIQEGMNDIEKKLKLLVNSELDKVDDGYDKLCRKLVLLQSNLSESYENNSHEIIALEQKYIDFQTMITQDLDVIQKYTLSLEEEWKIKMDEWSGSSLDSKICDLYCCVRAALEGNSIQGAFTKILEVNFPHIKFNEIPNDVCVRNLKLVNPTHCMFSPV